MLNNDNTEERKIVEHCYKKHKTVVNPIVEWTAGDVWELIKEEQIPYCELYNEGFERLGCIGCPMARKHGREKEFIRWPKYKDSYMAAFDRMLRERELRGRGSKWQTAKDVFLWWMEYDVLPGQFNLFEDYEDDSW